MIILKVLFLLWAVALLPRMVRAIVAGDDSPLWAMWIWALGVTGFITCQWLL